MITLSTVTATVTGLGLPQWDTDTHVTGVEVDYTITVEALATTDDPHGTLLHSLLTRWWGPGTKPLGLSTCHDIALNLLNSVLDEKLEPVRVTVTCAVGVGSTIWITQSPEPQKA